MLLPTVLWCHYLTNPQSKCHTIAADITILTERRDQGFKSPVFEKYLLSCMRTLDVLPVYFVRPSTMWQQPVSKNQLQHTGWLL